MALYKGYSSFEFDRRKTFKMYDKDLVNMDLLNHIYTQKGSRLKMPNFGTIIPTIAFENITEDLLSTIYDELSRVFDYDPRVEKLSLVVMPLYDINTISASATLRYIELDEVDTFELHIQPTI